MLREKSDMHQGLNEQLGGVEAHHMGGRMSPEREGFLGAMLFLGAAGLAMMQPVATCIGFLGAAIGLSERGLRNQFEADSRRGFRGAVA